MWQRLAHRLAAPILTVAFATSALAQAPQPPSTPPAPAPAPAPPRAATPTTPPAAPAAPATPPAAPAAPPAAAATPPAGGQAAVPADPNRPAGVPEWFFEMDIDKDKYVSREEFVSARLKVFRDLDANKDDIVTLEEFQKLAEPPHSVDGPGVPPLAERQKFFEAQFRQMDVDRDGKLTREEVEAFVIVNFNDFDLNRDGRISIPEVYQVMRSQTPRNAQQQQPRPESVSLQDFVEGEVRNILQLDTNSDGKVSLEEFLVTAGPADNDPNLPKGTPPLAQRRAFATQRFNELDANKDKFLDRNELSQFLTKRFKEMDGNSDGILTTAEMQAYIQKQQALAQQQQRQQQQQQQQQQRQGGGGAGPGPRPAPAPQAGPGGMTPGAPLPTGR